MRPLALADPDPEVRRAAVSAMATTDAVAVGQVLLAALDDPAPSVTVAALEHLGASHIDDPRRLSPALGHASPSVRVAAATAIGLLGLSQLLPELRERACDSGSPSAA